MHYNFDSIAGYVREKAELMRLCDIFNNREKYEAKGAKMPKGIIFYGETGTGKTLFAKVMASVCKLKVFKISLGNIDSEVAICGMIKRTFEAAAKCGEQVMIFFDELDKVMPDYSEDYVTDVSKAVLAQLLTLIDGMDSTNNIVFVATCNYYSSLPDALTRPGRIDRKIGLGLPGFSSRVAILEMYAKRTSCTFEMGMDEIASLTNGLSCAALETLINECVLQSDDNGFVSTEQLRKRFFEIENEDITRVRSQLDETVDSCRNVGALIVARSLDDGDYTLTMDAHRIGTDLFGDILYRYSNLFDRAMDFDEDEEIDKYYSSLQDEDREPYDPSDDDDYDYSDEDDDDEESHLGSTVYSQDDLLNTITVCLGGPAAEEVILHKLYDNVQYLYTAADEVLLAMAKSGMLGVGNLGAWCLREYIGLTEERKEAMCQAYEKVLEKCYLRAKDIIGKNEAAARDLVNELVKREAIGKEQCEAIFAAHGGIIC